MPRGTAGALPFEDIDGVLLVRSVEDDSLPLAALAEVATVSRDEGVATVVVASADPGGQLDTALWARLGALLDSLRARGVGRVRLVMSGAGDDRPNRPCVARRIADAWELEVTAPDGAVLIAPGGVLFVHAEAAPGSGWWRFAPGAAPLKLGSRVPVPGWQAALDRLPSTVGGCVVVRIPAGVLLLPAEAPRPELDALCFAMPVDFERPAVLVGAPQAEDVAADEVTAVLTALPAAQRSRVRLVPGGRRDLLRLGHTVADQLDCEVEILTGLPLVADHAPPGTAARVTAVGADGKPGWQPFVSSVTCVPADAQRRMPVPRLTEWHLPDWLPAGTERGTVRLTDSWQAVVTRAGLALWNGDGPRPLSVGLPVDPETCAIELGAPGQPLDNSLLPALGRLLAGLGERTRARTTLLVRGRLIAGEGELRRLAAEHGVLRIRYVTAGGPRRVRPAAHPSHVATIGGSTAAGAANSPVRERVPEAAAVTKSTAGSIPGAPTGAPAREERPGTDLGSAVETGTTGRPDSVGRTLSGPGAGRGTADGSRNGAGVSAKVLEAPPRNDESAAMASDSQVDPKPEGTAGVGDVPPSGGGVAAGAATREGAGPAAAGAPQKLAGRRHVPDADQAEWAEWPPKSPGRPERAESPVRTGRPERAESARPPVMPPERLRSSARPSRQAESPGSLTVTPEPPRATGTRAEGSPPRGVEAEPVPSATAGSEPVSSPRARSGFVPLVPGHVSSDAERAAFRELASAVWEQHAAAVTRLLTRMPALRGEELEAARADLIAAHVYLTAEEGPLGHRELIHDTHTGEGRLSPYAGCLASALRRLPTYRGVVLRGGDPTGPEPAIGTLLQDPGPVSALVRSSELPAGAGVRYAIWSSTGRRTRQLLDRPVAESPEPFDEIVFAPGTGFRVLGARTAPDGSRVVLLRELLGNATAYMTGELGAEELSKRDLVALVHLEEAIAEDFTARGSRSWPERCTGPVGHDG